jgi:hypothetical protein
VPRIARGLGSRQALKRKLHRMLPGESSPSRRKILVSFLLDDPLPDQS